MRRFACLCFLALVPLCLAAGPTPRKAVPLEVSGDVVTVVRSLPCKITAAEGATVYLWNVPDGLTASADEHVLTVTAGKEGTYTVSVVVLRIDFDAKKVVKDRGETTLSIGKVAPPVPPGPDPKPPDPPVPPVPVGPLRVLIVYESADLPKLPKEQHNVLFDMKVRGVLRDRTDKAGPDGRGYCIWDKDVDASGANKFWQDALKRPRPSLPYVHVWKGDVVAYEGPLPKSSEEMINLVTKHAAGGK